MKFQRERWHSAHQPRQSISAPNRNFRSRVTTLRKELQQPLPCIVASGARKLLAETRQPVRTSRIERSPYSFAKIFPSCCLATSEKLFPEVRLAPRFERRAGLDLVAGGSANDQIAVP